MVTARWCGRQWRVGWLSLLLALTACASGTAPAGPISPTTGPVATAATSPAATAPPVSTAPSTPAPPVVAIVAASAIPSVVEPMLSAEAALAAALRWARAGSSPGGGARLVGEPTEARGRVVSGAEVERLRFGRVLPAAERKPGLTDRPVWVVYLRGEMIALPVSSSPPSCVTGQPPPTPGLLRLMVDAVSGQVEGGSTWPVGRGPDIRAEPLLRPIRATATSPPPPTATPIPPQPVTPLPPAGGLGGRQGDRLTLPPAVGRPRGPDSSLALYQSGAPPPITQLEAMRAVAATGAPWGLGGVHRGQPIVVAAWYGCLLAHLPGETTFPLRLPDGQRFEPGAWRPVWVIEYGNLAGVGSGAPAEPAPTATHAAYLIDAQTRTVVLSWWYRAE